MNALNRIVLGLLSTFVSGLAFAQTADASGAAPDPMKGLLLNLPIFVALFLLFYFGLIRPQKAQQKKHVQFLTQLNRGDEVVTASGIIGKIVGVTDRVVTLEVSQGTEIKVLRTQVQGYLKDAIPSNA